MESSPCSFQQATPYTEPADREGGPKRKEKNRAASRVMVCGIRKCSEAGFSFLHLGADGDLLPSLQAIAN